MQTSPDWRERLAVVVAILGSIAVLTQMGVLAMAGLLAAIAAMAIAGIRSPNVALYIFAASVPFETAFRLSGPVTTLSRAAGLLLVVSYVVGYWNKLDLRVYPAFLLAWGAWALTSLLWSTSDASLPTAVTLVQLLALAGIAAHLVQQDESVGVRALITYGVSASLVAMAGLLQFADVDTERIGRAAAFESQSAAHFGALMVPVVLIGAWLFATLDTTRTRTLGRRTMLACAFVVCAAGGLLASGTRSAWLATAVGLVMIASRLLTRRSGVRRTLAVLAAASLAIALLFAMVPDLSRLVSTRLDTAVTTGGAGRVDIWAVGLGIARDNPAVGVGLGDFELAFDERAISRPAFETDEYVPVETGRASHSIYISILAELGIVGLILWFGFMASLYRRGLPDVAFVSLAIVTAFLAEGFFLDILNRKYFWLMVGIYLGLSGLARTDDPAASGEVFETRKALGAP